MELTSSSVGACGPTFVKEKGEIDIVTGTGTTELTGHQCFPLGSHWAYDTRAVGRHGEEPRCIVSGVSLPRFGGVGVVA